MALTAVEAEKCGSREQQCAGESAHCGGEGAHCASERRALRGGSKRSALPMIAQCASIEAQCGYFLGALRGTAPEQCADLERSALEQCASVSWWDPASWWDGPS